MTFDDSVEEAAFRAEARAWLDANAPTHLYTALVAAAARATSTVHVPEIEGVDVLQACLDWQLRKFDGGWACLHWPVEYGGRGASAIQRVIWQQEEGVYAQLSQVFAVGHGMVGPTIMAHGSIEQKDRYLRPIASGQDLWCQLFSEPSGGSDLAGLRTRATCVDKVWIVNGQKIWTTHAQIAKFGLLLARTDPTVPKHEGLTMFALDMKSSGVEVRPIKQMTGEATFNEVFLSDVAIPDDDVIGRPKDGWRVSLTTLMNERLSLAASIPTGVRELVDFCCKFETPNGLAIDDRNVRAKIADWAARASGLEQAMRRTISALSSGNLPGPENSIGKLVSGDMVQDLAAFALDLQGPGGAIVQEDEASRRFQRMFLSAASIRVGGGTAEIQRNIIAERILGLPAEIRVDKGIPYNRIPAGTQ
jgi:alkylation response protein AidB-like acyl-CoA dehydrogenase